ncbi:hypothetical protein [Kaistella montana]|uniref:Uncharacterized protein n=1 Tax=Kaistella montana TaxID=1849733 RepID=A0ABW5KBV6_9FLAO|nr:hypothetical protein [Kaistella montana]MCQ4035598.1 hypothetical protein [Kaistella montana]
MTKLNFSFILLLFLISSCSVEKINLSPIGDNVSAINEQSPSYSFDQKKQLIVYSSEITNLISSFPKFRNDAVNSEVSLLKFNLKEYIFAMQSYNLTNLSASHRKFEKSYKKLQKLRKYLNKDEDEVLNRYLVRIKTNMTFIHGNIPQDSTTIIIKN